VIRFAAAAAALLFAGCVFAGGPEDLGPVCERKTATPWHPYSPDALMQMTQAPADLSQDEKLALLAPAALRLLTLGGAPYAGFNSSLTNDSTTWTFHARGVFANATDEYDFPVAAREVVPPEVDAPNALRTIAWHVANQTPETSDASVRGQLLGAQWSSELPGCVRIAFSTGEGRQPTEIVVSMGLYRVVQAKGPVGG